jgi:hypothetical protein
MTREEFEEQYRELELKEREIKIAKHKLEEEYRVSVNEPYNHLIGKKVRVTYISDDWGQQDQILTTETYWGGFICNFGITIPSFYNAKKDGTVSTQRHRFGCMEVVSMEEI